MTDVHTTPDPTVNGDAPTRPRNVFAGIARWEEPPPRRTGPTGQAAVYDAAVEDLRARPGAWALVWEDATTPSVSELFRKRGCQTTTRANADSDPKTWSVWARWPEDAPEEELARP